ncbi:hypothetical protein D1007_53692 [Hordeum vulgare]|nr:hypothetical protein D1007_53692 [Hordeum vulgare]
MGPTATPARVTFWAGPFTTSGERVAHGLFVRYDTLDYVNDNARRLEDADFPVDGSIVSFGLPRVYVAVVADCYTAEVACDDALPWLATTTSPATLTTSATALRCLPPLRRPERPAIRPRSARRWSRSAPPFHMWPT